MTEELSQPQEPSADVFTKEMQHYVLQAAKWANFLGIVGFILSGLMVIFAFTMGSLMGAMSAAGAMPFAIGGVFFTIILLAYAALLFAPSYFLFRFGSKAKSGINYANVSDITVGLQNMKSFFKFYGIMMIVMLAIYALIFLFAILGRAMMGG